MSGHKAFEVTYKGMIYKVGLDSKEAKEPAKYATPYIRDATGERLLTRDDLKVRNLEKSALGGGVLGKPKPDIKDKGKK